MARASRPERRSAKPLVVLVGHKPNHHRIEQQFPIAELALLGHQRNREAVNVGLIAHRHDFWELSWIRSGSVDWWVGEELYEVGPGDCYLTRPGETHGAVSGMLEPCDLYWLNFDAKRLAGLETTHARELRAIIDKAPRVIPCGDQTAVWENLFAAVNSPAALRALSTRAALHLLLARLLQGSPRQQPSAGIAKAIARADQGPADVATLARAAGMSVVTFHRQFARDVGESPGAWLRRRRIRQAKLLLINSRLGITEIAYELGFPSSQRFATMFGQHTGLTPRAYRERAALKS